MNSMTAKTKKLIVDLATVIMLVVAFGLAYYTGLVGTKETGEAMLDTKVFGLISIAGSLLLMCVGGVSELLSRIQRGTVTWSFTAFMAIQVFAFVGMCAIVIGLLSGAFATDSAWIRGLFLTFVAVQVVGYVQAVIYSNTLEAVEGVEEDEEEDIEEDIEEDAEEADEDVSDDEQ